MKIIQLHRYSDGLPIAHTIVDDVDCDHLNQWTWNFHNGHAQRREGEKVIFLFDVVAERAGLTAPGKTISHFVRDPLDNRRANLRPVSSPDNGQRLEHHRVEGVKWNNMAHKWKAEIEIGGHKTSLGHYARLDQANSVVAQAKADSVPDATGVGRNRAYRKWYARINVDGSERFLGYFDTKVQAVAARREAEKERAEKKRNDYADQGVFQQIMGNGKWYVRFNLDGGLYMGGGYFDTPEEAVAARKKHEKERKDYSAQCVYFNEIKEKWYTLIYLDGRGWHHTYHDTPEEALTARREAEKEYKARKFLAAQKAAQKVAEKNANLPAMGQAGKFHTMVEIDGKEVFLGYFDTVAETVAARNAAENPPKCVYFDAEKGQWYVFIVDVCGWGTSTAYFDTPGEADTARHMAMKARDENRAARDAKKAREALRADEDSNFLEEPVQGWQKARREAKTEFPDGTGFDSCRGWYVRRTIDGSCYFFGYYTTWEEAVAVTRAVRAVPDGMSKITEPKTQIVGTWVCREGNHEGNTTNSQMRQGRGRPRRGR